MSPYNESLTQRLMFGLWVNWTLTILSAAVVLVFPFIMSKSWLPLPVAAISYLLLVYSRREFSSEGTPGCVLTLRVALLTLFWSALIMETINVLNTHALLDGYIDWSRSNRNIPYIVGLILFPVLAANCLWQNIRGYDTRFCRNCQARNGYYPGGGVVSTIYSRESRYQVMLILYISIAFSLIQWWYYWCYYINVNMNTPDRFFFNYMPIAVLLLSIPFMWSRYTNLGHIIGPLTESENDRFSVLRFMVVSGDFSLLSYDADHDRYDTPLRAETTPGEVVSDTSARRIFTRAFGSDNFTLRHLYTSRSHNMRSEVIHYAAFIPESTDGEPQKGHLHGEWLSLDQIDRLLKSARLSAELADELYRIFTITMAWKTYDRNGHRLYPIRHYRPTFRLRDMPAWDVDYGDLSWLTVADNNQDRPFFRTRRLWRRITGMK